MNFSAADLCKRSASQICFLRNNPGKIIVTPEQLSGIKKQAKATKSDYIEMCGLYIEKDINIYFSWDEVQKTSGGVLKLIEHKAVLDSYEPWYKNNSLLQTAIYGALTVKVPKLSTAKFYQKLGNPKKDINLLGWSRRFYLQFGDEKYRVRLENSTLLRQFLVDKARASINFTTAKEFDSKWKHKEFILLKNSLSYARC